MVDWKSPEVQAATYGALIKIGHVFIGLYIWELLTSFDFEWDFITGKRKFRWPLVFYFANRYVMLGSLASSLVVYDAKPSSPTSLNCNTLFLFTFLMGNMSLGLASINLAIRTIALWSRNLYVTSGLVGLMIGHWTIIIFQARSVRGSFVPGVGCIPGQPNFRLVAVMFIYSLCFDTVVLALNVYKLFGQSSSRHRGFFKLTNMVFQQGLIFFLIAFLVNLVEIIFLFLDLNLGMSGLFAVIAELTSTIVACRAVRSLSSYVQDGPDIVVKPLSSSGLHSRRGHTHLNSLHTGTEATGHMVTLDGNSSEKSGVMVQMETISRRDSFTK